MEIADDLTPQELAREATDELMPELIALGHMKEINGKCYPTDEFRDRCIMLLNLLGCGAVDTALSFEMLMKQEPIEEEYDRLMDAFAERVIEAVYDHDGDGISEDDLANKLGCDVEWFKGFVRAELGEPSDD